ncbi:MAG: YkoP family protein [Dehalococcoidia bacterium]
MSNADIRGKQPAPNSSTPFWIGMLLWPVIGRLLRVIYRIRPLRDDGTAIICLDLRRYRGSTITLYDGSMVRTGDRIIELHINDAWFEKRRKLNTTTSDSPWEILGCLRLDLCLLAQQMGDGMFEDVVALHGSTLLHAGAARLGFQVEEIPDTLWKKVAFVCMARLLQVHHQRAGKVSRLRARPLELKGIWLSRAALLDRYGPKHSCVQVQA